MDFHHDVDENEAVICAVWELGSIPRWIPFENWSTTTKIVVLPWYGGSPAIKSRERSSQGRLGTGNGHKRPAALRALYFVTWQSTHLVTNYLTSSLSPCHLKFSEIRANVLVTPAWPPIGVAWYSISKVVMSGIPLGNQMRPAFSTKFYERENWGWSWGASRIACLSVVYSEFASNCLWSSSIKVNVGTDRIRDKEEFVSGSRDRASAAWLWLSER